eukprot:scaffold2319_cov350-Pavlova_lutheri.AAC.15
MDLKSIGLRPRRFESCRNRKWTSERIPGPPHGRVLGEAFVPDPRAGWWLSLLVIRLAAIEAGACWMATLRGGSMLETSANMLGGTSWWKNGIRTEFPRMRDTVSDV